MADELAPLVTPEEAAAAAELDALIDGASQRAPRKAEPEKAPEPAPVTQERDYEAEARAMGWKPKEEWNGDPGKHRDAQTFVELADNDPAILRRKNDELRKQNEEFQQRTVAATKAEIERTRREAEAAVQAERQRLADERDELIQRYAGDPNAIKRINYNFELAQNNLPDPQVQVAATEVRTEWESKFPQVAADPVFKASAALIMQELVETEPAEDIQGKTHKQRQERLFERMNERLAQSPAYGQFFKTAPKPAPISGAPPADMRTIEAPMRSQQSNPRGFDALPKEAKNMFQMLVDDGIKIKKEDFAKDYYNG
jgi:hypothetical protein